MEPLLGLSDDEVRQKILWSHGITRLGTQAWLFIGPLVLLRFTPGRLTGPASWGFATTTASLLISPALGSWADRTSRRRVVACGVIAQAVGVLGSTAVLLLSLQREAGKAGSSDFLALLFFLGFSIVEELGTVLSDVSVKRDWTPRLFAGDMLKSMNSTMSQIDLISKTVGPLLAGLLITPRLAIDLGFDDAEAAGFVSVGLLNAMSFAPQLRLLLQVYDARIELLQPMAANQQAPHEQNQQNHQNPMVPVTAWKAWWHHPSGIQFLSFSYAFLYFTVLSPAGSIMTAYLMLKSVASWQLSLMRCSGALLGVFGVAAYPRLVAKLGCRGTNSASVAWLVCSIVLAVGAFRSVTPSGPAGLYVLIFVVAVCMARPGLYVFELGVLNAEQDLVDARHRSAIGAVDMALTSAGTLVAYGSSLILDRPEQFKILVNGSSLFIILGGATYWLWTQLFHSHLHRHDDHSQDHPHTLQQEAALEDGWHDHLHYYPAWWCLKSQ
ncbi:unnamed protein product [Symbiodinium natans]|uniref:Solute carrier family 40 member n=1 Tax=Symbiodinium natans TaxID=878477 RepID=A0A812IAX1_9DINO|nr:unnamed protein product [Symbiodinium natans]